MYVCVVLSCEKWAEFHYFAKTIFAFVWLLLAKLMLLLLLLLVLVKLLERYFDAIKWLM